MPIKSSTTILVKRLEARFKALREQGVEGVQVGSYGVPYAAFHEYGTKWSEKMWWGFMRARKGLKRQPPKGVMQFKREGKEIKSTRIRERPFLRPALQLRQDMILNILRQTVAPDPISKARAFTRIGTILETQIVRNIRTQRIINTGNLINSIRYELMTK
jgi:hypothetical protein